MLQFADAAFDPAALLVQLPVVFPLLFAVAARWNHDFSFHGLLYMLDNLVRVVALVGYHHLRLAFAQQLDGYGVVALLSGGEAEFQRQSQFVDEQVNLGRQSSSGTPQSLVRAPFCGPWPLADVLAPGWNRSLNTGSSGPPPTRQTRAPTPPNEPIV